MESNKIKIGLVQVCSTENILENITKCNDFVGQAIDEGARIIVLPEDFLHIGIKQADVAPQNEVDFARDLFAEKAKAMGVYILLGGVPIYIGKKHYNRSILIDPEGREISDYEKIHLFDVDVNKDVSFKESDHVHPGKRIVTHTIDDIIFGFSICYDLRFPELYRKLALAGAKVCFVTAAFTHLTGSDHWRVLLRARAIENMMYIVAANQTGKHNKNRQSYGRSCIVHPWGFDDGLDYEEGIYVKELDLDQVKKARKQIPCLDHIKLIRS